MLRWLGLGVALGVVVVALGLSLRHAPQSVGSNTTTTRHIQERYAFPSLTVGVRSELEREETERASPLTLADFAAIQQVVHHEGVPQTQVAGLNATRRLPAIVQAHPELADLPPVCVSSLPGIELLPPANEIVVPEEVGTTNVSLHPAAPPLPSLSESPELYNPHAQASADWKQVKQEIVAENAGLDPHAEVFAKSQYPSATECRKCHEQIYEEWAISSHANAGVSPMFHKFEQKLNALAQGTLGYFCMRCHAPVAVTMKQPRWESIGNGPKVFREGVTCVACHRVVEKYAKTNGERRMEPGPLESPIVGSSNGAGLQKVLEQKDEYKVKLDPQDESPGQLIHGRVIQFEQLSESTFCVSCHQVAVHPGIKLEVVWEQYRHSPAYQKGITCQDCHTGRVPGKAEGYCESYVAIINGKPSGPPRKHTNHAFFGPGYSIAHPGIFPQNPDADRWTMHQWLLFDWRAGWGTEAFEEQIESGALEVPFPPEWQNVDDRLDAREVLDANFKRLRVKDELRRQVMENGSRIDGPYFDPDCQHPSGAVVAGRDLKLNYLVTNKNEGHNMPTGSLGAQPQLWLNAVLVGPDGRKVWESGYLDTSGDLADRHSADVHNGKVPFDRQLFNLQTKFLITNIKGTDREMPLPVNIDIDQLPFIRPAPQPVTVLNHPPFIRMEAHSIAPCGSRRAKYHIPGSAIARPGVYRLSVRMRSRGEPMYFMKFVDSTPEMMRSMNEKILDIHPYTVAFEVR
jgi:nitrate/TMAO reductase-like tetraheme cytochrome c subunit